MNDLSELQKIMKLCRKQGVSKFKCDQYEFELSVNALPSKRIRRSKDETLKDPVLENLPQDAALFWSSTSESAM